MCVLEYSLLYVVSQNKGACHVSSVERLGFQAVLLARVI